MKLVAGFVVIVTLVGVVTTFGREYGAALFVRTTEFEKVTALTAAALPLRLPMSIRATREVFETCATVRLGLLYGFQTAESRQRIDRNCSDLAAGVLDRSPTFSAAHTAIMLHAPTSDRAATALVLSWSTAPFDLWEAQKRVSTGLPLFGRGMDDLDQSVTSDVRFLLQLAAGREHLAQLYTSDPDLRPTLVQLIEAAPSADQAAFLSRVRHNAR
jgi:hypothetical protein